jgi:glycosyltransferase involved in cell wall biosynthesis
MTSLAIYAGELVVDARSLQDMVLRQRGIGRVLRILLSHRKTVQQRRPALEVVALVDDRFPDLSPSDKALFNSIRPIDSAPVNGAIFLNPSPMSFDPARSYRYITCDRTIRFAICYDFIPIENPEIFLRAPANRLRYLSQLAMLERYDFYFSISDATDQKLRRILPRRSVESAVIGCPIAPRLVIAGKSDMALQARSIFLVIGDPSEHKDVATAIRGHARSLAEAKLFAPLVVTGRIPDARKDELFQEHRALSGSCEHLEFVGPVADSTLEQLYCSAIAVIVPSRAEGFSVPVVEAMSCRSVPVVSDIDVHRALVSQKSLRFPLGDDRELADILAWVAADSSKRAAIVHENEGVWSRFTVERIAPKFWAKLYDVTDAWSSGAVERF